MTEKLVLVVTVTALCMISPGPDMLLVMRNTLVRDRHYGALTALGVLTGNLIHIGYCVVGIAVLVSRNPVLFQVLRVRRRNLSDLSRHSGFEECEPWRRSTDLQR